jgi:hypothetical protein
VSDGGFDRGTLCERGRALRGMLIGSGGLNNLLRALHGALRSGGGPIRWLELIILLLNGKGGSSDWDAFYHRIALGLARQSA